MSADTDELLKEAIKMNSVSKRIKMCFQWLDGQMGFDIDYTKRCFHSATHYRIHHN